MVKKGDTLIEVTLAVGIFSMIAIAIVAVMSNGTAGAQTALETTLAREEIDAQAEALRFIHDAAAADKDSASSNSGQNSSSFYNLWDRYIVAGASAPGEEITNYAPTNCEEVYKSLPKNSFVINTRKLGDLNDSNSFSSIQADRIIIKKGNTYVPLERASTYPHLIYTTNGTQNSNDVDNKLVDSNNNTGSLFRAEGIFIVPVVGKGNGSEDVPEFYDFYIRTCWYSTNADTPSTISTVIRLYNPDYTVDTK